MRKIWAMLLLALLCTSIYTSLAIASSGDEEEEAENEGLSDSDDRDENEVEEEEAEEERKLSVEASGDRVEVESEIEKAGLENEFEILIDVEDGVRMRLKYSNETEQGENETESELEIHVKLLALVEYVDENRDGVFTLNDTVVQEMDLTELSYSLTWSRINSTDGETGYQFKIMHMQDTFNFTVIAKIFPKHAVVDDWLLKPTEMKITYVIVNFPYRNETSSLALQINAISKMEFEEETTERETKLKVKSETAEGYFSWSENATVDGVVRPVNSSITLGEEATIINLCYPRGDTTIHDPILGVDVITQALLWWKNPLAAPSTFIGLATVAILVVVALYLLEKRELKHATVLPSIS